jgi:hypothetical protein
MGDDEKINEMEDNQELIHFFKRAGMVYGN